MPSKRKQTLRVCPGCETKKLFDDRNDTCSPECAAEVKRRAAADARPQETQTINGDQREIRVNKTRIQTLEELVSHCKIDLSIWEVVSFVVNKWEVGAVLGKREKKAIVVEPLFQVKATLRKKVAVVSARAEIEELKKEAKSHAKLFSTLPPTGRHSGNMLEINIPDLHVGKLAWAKETGWDNYDVRIAETVYEQALDALVTRTCSYQFERVLLVLGNDLLNSDNREGQTTAGTNVSSDVRFQKTFAVVRRLITRTIERLRLIAPVEVIMVPGNHDTLSVWHLGDSLECYFDKCPDVRINNAPTARKYHQFGKVMLMFTHGHQGKPADYPLLMATEQPKMFGSTVYREAHTGHNHKTKLDEQHGVRVRVLPALCAEDDWHAENGFVGNIRSAEAYVWNKDEGLVTVAMYSVPRESQQQAA